MKARHAMLVALAAAVTLTAVAAAGPDAAKQRVVITSGASQTTQVAPFVLTPLQAGALKRDVSGMCPHVQRTDNNKVPICRHFMEALFRTRTGDPLLTMEVSGRHARTRAIIRDAVSPAKSARSGG
jgi:hypothetical protein